MHALALSASPTLTSSAFRGRTACGLPAPPSRLAGPFYVGQLVASTYEVTGLLGAGGMGVVYDATDRTLRRRVAIKTALSTVFREELLREARALAALRNPSFPCVHALLQHEGIDFIVMERLYGETLDKRIALARSIGKKITLEEVIDIVVQLAVALAAAHDAGVSQRDVKPSNVMLCADRVVLFDFGLVVPEVLVAPSTIISGSAEYVAPEVLLGSVEKGGGPSIDLYALGVVAFELLTNTTPFASDMLPRIVARHISESPPDVRDRRPDVPDALAFLVRQLLAKAPHERPPSAEAVIWELDHMRARSCPSEAPARSRRRGGIGPLV
jgi:eukaryotic-like serine/threonine-protein kinase